MIRRGRSNKTPSAVNAAENETLSVGKGIVRNAAPNDLATLVDSCNFSLREDGSYSLRKPDIVISSLHAKAYPLRDEKHVLTVNAEGKPQVRDLVTGYSSGVSLKYREQGYAGYSYYGPTALKVKPDAEDYVSGERFYLYIPPNAKAVRLGDVTLLPVRADPSLITNLIDSQLYASNPTVPRYISIYNEGSRGWVFEIIDPEVNTIPTTDSAESLKPNLLLDNPYAVRDLYGYGMPSVTAILPYMYKGYVSSYSPSYVRTAFFQDKLNTLDALFQIYFQAWYAGHGVGSSVAVNFRIMLVARQSLCFVDPRKLFPKASGISDDETLESLPRYDARSGNGFQLDVGIVSSVFNGSVCLPAYMPKGTSCTLTRGVLSLNTAYFRDNDSITVSVSPHDGSPLSKVYVIPDGASLDDLSEFMTFEADAITTTMTLAAKAEAYDSTVNRTTYTFARSFEGAGLNIIAGTSDFSIIADPWIGFGPSYVAFKTGIVSVTPENDAETIEPGAVLAKFADEFEFTFAKWNLPSLSNPLAGRVKHITEGVSSTNSLKYELLSSLGNSDVSYSVVVLKAIVTTPAHWHNYYCRWERSVDGGMSWVDVPEFMALWKSSLVKLAVSDVLAGTETLESAGKYVKTLHVVPFDGGQNPYSNDDYAYSRPDVLPIAKTNAKYQYRFRIFKASDAISSKAMCVAIPSKTNLINTILPRNRDASVFYHGGDFYTASAGSDAYQKIPSLHLFYALENVPTWCSDNVVQASRGFSTSAAGVATVDTTPFATATSNDPIVDDFSTSIPSSARTQGAYVRYVISNQSSNIPDFETELTIAVQCLHGATDPEATDKIVSETLFYNNASISEPLVQVTKFNSRIKTIYVGEGDYETNDTFDVADGNVSSLRSFVAGQKIKASDIPNGMFVNVSYPLDSVYFCMPKDTCIMQSVQLVGNKAPENAASAGVASPSYMKALTEAALEATGSSASSYMWINFISYTIGGAIDSYNVNYTWFTVASLQNVHENNYSTSIHDTFMNTYGSQQFVGVKATMARCQGTDLQAAVTALIKAFPAAAFPQVGMSGGLPIPKARYDANGSSSATEIAKQDATAIRTLGTAIWLSKIILENDVDAAFTIHNVSNVPMAYVFDVDTMKTDEYCIGYSTQPWANSSKWYLKTPSSKLKIGLRNLIVSVIVDGVESKFDKRLGFGDKKVVLNVPANSFLDVVVRVRAVGYFKNLPELLTYTTDSSVASESIDSEGLYAVLHRILPNETISTYDTFYYYHDDVYVPALMTELMPNFRLNSIAGYQVFGAPTDNKMYWLGIDRNNYTALTVTRPATSNGSSAFHMDGYISHDSVYDVPSLWESPNAYETIAKDTSKDIATAVELSFVVDTGLTGTSTEYVDRTPIPVTHGKQVYYERRILTYGVNGHENTLYVSDPDSYITPLQGAIDFSYGSAITAVIPWRDYVLVFTENATYMLLKDSSSSNGFSTRTVNSQIGIPKSDGPSVQAILNGILFKSGDKAYVYVPGRYSTVDTMLNVRRISDAVEGFLFESADVLSFIQDDKWHLFQKLPGSNVGHELVYDYVKNAWTRNEHAFFPTDEFVYGNSWRMVIRGGKDVFSFDRDWDSVRMVNYLGAAYNLSLFADLPYGDFVADSVDLGVLLSTYNPTVATNLSQYASKIVPIAYSLDTGQKSSRFTVDKQFLELKLNVMSLDEKDAFPFSATVYANGMPHAHVVDANTDSPLWRDSKTLDGGALATTFGDSKTSNVGIMRQMFLKYSGRGKTIRITLSGQSQSRFALYTIDSRYRVLPNKQ